MSSGGRWWISMGPLGWLILGWIILPVMAAWYTGWLLFWLTVAIVTAIREYRHG